MVDSEQAIDCQFPVEQQSVAQQACGHLGAGFPARNKGMRSTLPTRLLTSMTKRMFGLAPWLAMVARDEENVGSRPLVARD